MNAQRLSRIIHNREQQKVQSYLLGLYQAMTSRQRQDIKEQLNVNKHTRASGYDFKNVGR